VTMSSAARAQRPRRKGTARHWRAGQEGRAGHRRPGPAVRRSRFVRLSGGTCAVSRDLRAMARALAGIRGYLTSPAVCPGGAPVAPGFVTGACRQLFRTGNRSRCPRATCGPAHLPPQARFRRGPPAGRLAALAVSCRSEDRAGWPARGFVRAARRYRTAGFQAGPHVIAAACSLPGGLRQAFRITLAGQAPDARSERPARFRNAPLPA
jgi:hypothetical protein